MKKKGVDIRDDQEIWLKEHEEVNLSGLVRKALDELMALYQRKEMSPAQMLSSA